MLFVIVIVFVQQPPIGGMFLVCMYSLGGALTELCALDLINNKIISNSTDIIIYTFGCPRWANKNLAQYFNNLDNILQNWRIVVRG